MSLKKLLCFKKICESGTFLWDRQECANEKLFKCGLISKNKESNIFFYKTTEQILIEFGCLAFFNLGGCQNGKIYYPHPSICWKKLRVFYLTSKGTPTCLSSVLSSWIKLYAALHISHTLGGK